MDGVNSGVGAQPELGDHAGVVPGRLFTWVDVDEHLAFLAAGGRWPAWLLEADAWWDQLVLTISPGTTEDQVPEWLDHALGRGSVRGAEGDLVLALDRPSGLGTEGIPVTLQRSQGRVAKRRVPRLAERRTTAELAMSLARPLTDGFTGDVQLIAFHSFKGGVAARCMRSPLRITWPGWGDESC